MMKALLRILFFVLCLVVVQAVMVGVLKGLTVLAPFNLGFVEVLILTAVGVALAIVAYRKLAPKVFAER